MMKHSSQVALGDIFEIARGGSPRPIDEYITDDVNGVNWIMIGDASSGTKYITATRKRIKREGISRSRLVKPGDFLLTNSMSFGHPYILKTTGCIHDGWLVLSPKRSDIDPDYFYHLLGSEKLYLEFSRQASGTTVKNLNIDIVRRVLVSFPSLTEQRRIAKILDKTDTIRRKRRQAIELMNSFLRSAFLEMFGDPKSNSKNWDLVPFGSLGECRLGKMLDAKKQTGQFKRPYLRNANVQWNRFELNSLLEMDFSIADRNEFSLRPGDVLICEGGEVGRAAIWQNQVAECYFQKALHRMRLDPDSATPEFIVFLMWELASNGGLTDHTTSATIAHLTGIKLKAIPVIKPPIDKQRQFATLYHAASRCLNSLQNSKAAVEECIAALAHKYFQGN